MAEYLAEPQSKLEIPNRIRRPYKQDDMARARHVMAGLIVGDPANVIYQLRETVRRGGAEIVVNSIWQTRPDGQCVRITSENIDASSPYTTGSGRIFFLGRQVDEAAGKTRVYRLDDGVAHPISNPEYDVSTFALSPDDQWIVFAAGSPAPPAPHIRINRIAYRFDSVPGYLHEHDQRLYLASSQGSEAHPLTSPDGVFSKLVWSPNSLEVAVVRHGCRDHLEFPLLGELAIITLDGNQRSLVRDEWIEELFWTDGGKRIGFVGLRSGDFTREFQLWLIDRTGGDREDRSSFLTPVPGNAFEIHNPTLYSASRGCLLGRDADVVVIAAAVGARTVPWQFALTGAQAATPLAGGDCLYRVLDVCEGKVLCTRQDFTTPPILVLIDATNGGETTLADPNEPWRHEVAPPAIHRVEYRAPDGPELEGWILMPSDDVGPHATLLCLHGGPFATFPYAFHEDFLELVGGGYAVAFTNQRGSTGYGDELAQAIVGRWGEPELADISAFLDALIAAGDADPQRLAVTGFSAGGHLTAWLIGQTNRFKAAIAEQGYYNMVSMYGVSDATIVIEQILLGPPHEQPELYWRLSPVAYAHRVTTPTLLIQGEDDIRCPMEEAEQYYTVLRRNGCDAELLRLKGCKHAAEVVGATDLRRARVSAIRDWLHRYLGVHETGCSSV